MTTHSFSARTWPRVPPADAAHLTVQVFAGPDAEHRALAGNVKMRADEAQAFVAAIPALDTLAAVEAAITGGLVDRVELGQYNGRWIAAAVTPMSAPFDGHGQAPTLAGALQAALDDLERRRS